MARTKADLERELAASRAQQMRQADTIHRVSIEHMDLQKRLGVFPIIDPVLQEPLHRINPCVRNGAHGHHLWGHGDETFSCLGIKAHPNTQIGGSRK